jgi:hypothetical protein
MMVRRMMCENRQSPYAWHHGGVAVRGARAAAGDANRRLSQRVLLLKSTDTALLRETAIFALI